MFTLTPNSFKIFVKHVMCMIKKITFYSNDKDGGTFLLQITYLRSEWIFLHRHLLVKHRLN